MKYDTGDWNKKIETFDAWDLQRDGHDGWDLDGDSPYTVRIDKIWEDGVDFQRDVLVWADDNCEGYFYQYTFGTEGGTPIIRAGDKFWIVLAFQKKEDAFAFKMRWV